MKLSFSEPGIYQPIWLIVEGYDEVFILSQLLVLMYYLMRLNLKLPEAKRSHMQFQKISDPSPDTTHYPKES